MGCDVGFAYDGDADRCLAVDAKGNLVDGDVIMYICGKYMKEQGTLPHNTVVTTIMSNFGLYKAFDRAGIRYEKTAVGDKYVYENMAQNGHGLGGEQSGHIIFSKHATTGDGILTSLKVMEVILEKKQTLDKLASEVEIYPQVLKNVRVKDKKAAWKGSYTRLNILGTVLCILGVVPLFFFAGAGDDEVVLVLALCIMLLIEGLGCVAFVYGGVYQAAMEKLLEEGDYTRKNKARQGIKGGISAIYWLIVTAVFFFYTYGPQGNGKPQHSWLIWVIGGLLYGGLMVLLEVIERAKNAKQQ